MTNQVSSNATIRNASYQVAPTMLAPTMWKINLVHHGIWFALAFSEGFTKKYQGMNWPKKLDEQFPFIHIFDTDSIRKNNNEEFD
jgi:hypothetical protein